jgi:putative transposase
MGRIALQVKVAVESNLTGKDRLLLTMATGTDLRPSNRTVLVRVFPLDFLGLGGAESDESLEVFRRAEGIYSEAGFRWGVPVADICRKAGISQATYFNWRRKYDGLLPTEMRRLKQLEDENGKLKKLVADLSLDREMLQDVIRRKI